MKKRLTRLIALLFLTGPIITACGGGGGGKTPQVTPTGYADYKISKTENEDGSTTYRAVGPNGQIYEFTVGKDGKIQYTDGVDVEIDKNGNIIIDGEQTNNNINDDEHGCGIPPSFDIPGSGGSTTTVTQPNPAYKHIWTVFPEAVDFYYSYNGHDELVKIPNRSDAQQAGDTWIKQFTFPMGTDRDPIEAISSNYEIKFYADAEENRIYPTPNEKIPDNNIKISTSKDLMPYLSLRVDALKPTCTLSIYSDHYEVFVTDYFGDPIDYNKEYHITETMTVTFEQGGGSGDTIKNPAYDVVYRETLINKDDMELSYNVDGGNVRTTVYYPQDLEPASGDKWIAGWKFDIYGPLRLYVPLKFFNHGWEIFPIVDETQANNNAVLRLDNHLHPYLYARQYMGSSSTIYASLYMYSDHYELFLEGYTGDAVNYKNDYHVEKTIVDDGSFTLVDNYLDGIIPQEGEKVLNPAYDMVYKPTDITKDISIKFSERPSSYGNPVLVGSDEYEWETIHNPEYNAETNNEVWIEKREFSIEKPFYVPSLASFPFYFDYCEEDGYEYKYTPIYPIPDITNSHNAAMLRMLAPTDWYGNKTGPDEPLIYTRVYEMMEFHGYLIIFEDHFEVSADGYDGVVNWGEEMYAPTKFIQGFVDAPELSDPEIVTTYTYIPPYSKHVTPKKNLKGHYKTTMNVGYFVDYYPDKINEPYNHAHCYLWGEYDYHAVFDGKGKVDIYMTAPKEPDVKIIDWNGEYCMTSNYFYVKIQTKDLYMHPVAKQIGMWDYYASSSSYVMPFAVYNDDTLYGLSKWISDTDDYCWDLFVAGCEFAMIPVPPRPNR